MATVGFIGVGTVSSAVIEAMCQRPDDDSPIVLSPRSESRSRDLAARHARCTRLETNQAVVDAADVVMLGMLPRQLDEVMADLTFRPDQTVVSFIAGSPPSQIAPLVAPAHRVCQAIPLPAIAVHRGPLVLCPGVPEVVDLFAGLGDIVVLEDESRIRVLSCASAIMSTYYEAQNAVIAWAAGRGIAPDVSRDYVVSLLDGLAAVSRVTPAEEFDHLPQEHQTPGGLNERVRAGLLERDWFGALTDRLDDIYDNAVLRPLPTD